MTTPPKPKPVYLVRGDDPSLLADAVRDLLASVTPAEDAALAIEDIPLDGGDEGTGVQVLLDACLTPPFLTDRRVVVGRNAGALSAGDAARLIEYLAAPLETTVLVFVGGS
jgi:DNA polymerase-3 subunit delta